MEEKSLNPDDQQETGLYQPGSKAAKRLRFRRNRRRAYIRSIYLLPSAATLGNAICGFAAIYIASLTYGTDPWTKSILESRFIWASYLIFAAMIFDAIDGRLARFARHTTDFGAQLDSMADVISFGVAPAILMLQVTKLCFQSSDLPFMLTRIIWVIGAIYCSCAVIRLARFNVSNQHGEEHHFSFLGLPSPGAAGVVASVVLLWSATLTDYSAVRTQLDASPKSVFYGTLLSIVWWTGTIAVWILPVITLMAGLLMVSTIRYPHIVNRMLRGRKTIPYLVGFIVVCGAIVIFHQYLLAVAMLLYSLYGIGVYLLGRLRRQPAKTMPPAKPAA